MTLTGVPGPPAAPTPLDRRRPNLAGDLRARFRAAPASRRAVRGYDRVQVDTYVRWAEDELAGAAPQRDDLLLRLRADLDEARRLLRHRPGGRESLQLSHRIGAVLAEAAAEADRLLTEAAAEADATVAEAERLLEEAEQTSKEARTEAAARLDKAQALQRRAAEDAERLRQEAAGVAAATRSQARDEVLRMLAAAREERRRAEAKAAALREQVERDAAARRAALEAGDADRRPAAVPVLPEVPAPRGAEDARGRRSAHLLLLGLRRR